MRRLSVFNFMTLNGFFKGPGEDISWNKHGAEEASFSAEGLQTGNVLLFGRTTYHLMESFWQTPAAFEMFPVVAEGMNKAEKIVFSSSLEKVEWNNTRLIKDNIVEEVKKIKKTPGKDLTLLGSGNILTQFAEHGLIDEYQIMIYPVAIGEGTPMFKGIGSALTLQLVATRTFKSGSVLLTYHPK